MIEQVCAFIHNYFVHDRYAGKIVIENGSVQLPLSVGQYFRICGSKFNDGVWQHQTGEPLIDETFDGVVWDMRPPRAFLQIVSDISDWIEKYGDAVSSPYQSESFGGYSYSLGGGTDANGAARPAGWQNTFGPYLNQWRKLC